MQKNKEFAYRVLQTYKLTHIGFSQYYKLHNNHGEFAIFFLNFRNILNAGFNI